MKRFGLFLFVFVLAMGNLALAQVDREQAKKLVDTYKNAVLKIRVIITQWGVFQGRESSKEESKYEIVGTVIDKKGTIVTSAFSLDPSNIFQRMFGGEDYQVKSELKELKIILPDNKEIEGQIVLRDDKLDLAFIRPKSPQTDVQFEYVDLDNASEPQLLDEVIGIQRMGENFDRTIFVSLSRIGAIISKPRVYYLPTDDFDPGSPVFSPDGKLVGLSTVRVTDTDSSSFSYLSTIGESPVLQAILPAKDIKGSAAQIKE